MKRLVLALCLAATSASCGGIFASSDVQDPRYFAPSSPAPEKEAAAPPGAAASPVKLRLGRVSSGKHLRQHIVFRSSPVEVGEYEYLRWTENPEEFVRRALLRSLFDDRGLTQAVGGAVPTVDVEVLAFEEVRQGDQRLARVSVSYAVRDDRVVVAAHTITVERDAGSSADMSKIVEAMSSALTEVSATIAEEIVKALEVENKVAPPPSASAPAGDADRDGATLGPGKTDLKLLPRPDGLGARK